MSNYTDKEKAIVKQFNEWPFHTLVTDLTNVEFENLTTKLIKDDDSYTLTSLIAIYRDYNRDKIIDYFIDKGDSELLLAFLDYCYDFSTDSNELNQKSIIDKLIKKNDKEFIKDILESNNTYFLTDKNEKERLITFIKENLWKKNLTVQPV